MDAGRAVVQALIVPNNWPDVDLETLRRRRRRGGEDQVG
jgi:hypothetical protein